MSIDNNSNSGDKKSDGNLEEIKEAGDQNTPSPSSDSVAPIVTESPDQKEAGISSKSDTEAPSEDSRVTSKKIVLLRYQRERIKEIRKIFLDPDLTDDDKCLRSERLQDEVCDSYHAYWRLYQEEENRRNFMRPSDIPHLIVKRLAQKILGGNDNVSCLPNISILELGPGVGNDGLYLIKNIPNLVSYRGLEASPDAIAVANRRIQEFFSLSKRRSIPVKLEEINFEEELKRMHITSKATGQIEYVTDVVAISSMHYFREKVFLRLVSYIHLLLLPTKGRFTLALKTPESKSFRESENVIIDKTEGYRVVLNLRDGIRRVFIQPDYLKNILSSVGFNMDRADQIDEVVTGYDFDGKKEHFRCIIARPKINLLKPQA